MNFEFDVDIKKIVVFGLAGLCLLVALSIAFIVMIGGIKLDPNAIFADGLQAGQNQKFSVEEVRFTFSPSPSVVVKGISFANADFSLSAKKLVMKKSFGALFSIKNSDTKKILVSDGKVVIYKKSNGLNVFSDLDKILSVSGLFNNSRYSIITQNTDIEIADKYRRTVFMGTNILFKNTSSDYFTNGDFRFLDQEYEIDFQMGKTLDALHDTRDIDVRIWNQKLDFSYEGTMVAKNGIMSDMSSKIDFKTSDVKSALLMTLGLGDKVTRMLPTINKEILLHLEFVSNFDTGKIETALGYIKSDGIDAKINMFKTQQSEPLNINVAFNDFNIAADAIEYPSAPVTSNGYNGNVFYQSSELPIASAANFLDIQMKKLNSRVASFVNFTDFISIGEFKFSINSVGSAFFAGNKFKFGLEGASRGDDIEINKLLFQRGELLKIDAVGLLQNIDLPSRRLFLQAELEGYRSNDIEMILDMFYLKNIFKLNTEQFNKIKGYKVKTDFLVLDDAILLNDFHLDVIDSSLSMNLFMQVSTASVNRYKILNIKLNNLDTSFFNLQDGILSTKYDLVKSSLLLRKFGDDISFLMSCHNCILNGRPTNDILVDSHIGNGIAWVNKWYIDADKYAVGGNLLFDANLSIPYLKAGVHVDRMDLGGYNFDNLKKTLINGVSVPNMDKVSGMLSMTAKDIQTERYSWKNIGMYCALNAGNCVIDKFVGSGVTKIDNKNADFNVNGNISFGSIPSMNLSYKFSGMEGAGLIEFFTGKDGVLGKISSTGKVSSSGDSLQSLLSGLSGGGDFEIKSPKIVAMDFNSITNYTLSKSRQKILKLDTGLIGNVIRGDGVIGEYDSMKGKLIFVDKFILCSDVSLLSKYSSGKLSAKLDLISDNYELTGRFVTVGLDVGSGLKSMVPLYASYAASNNNGGFGSKYDGVYNLNQIYTYAEARKMYK